MEVALAAAAAWLDAAGLSGLLRDQPAIYPAANAAHLLGLVMLVGGIGAVDLRIAGLQRELSVARLSRALTPVALGGLAISATTGVLLFAADARALAASNTFQFKLCLLAAALANAALFRLLWRTGDPALDAPPIAARVMAVTSLALWLSVGAAGRYIAYT